MAATDLQEGGRAWREGVLAGPLKGGGSGADSELTSPLHWGTVPGRDWSSDQKRLHQTG